MVTGDIHHQSIVVRDFLGLGSLASPSIPEEIEEFVQQEASFMPNLDAMAGGNCWLAPGFTQSAAVHPAAHFNYMKNALWNEHVNMQRVLSFGKSVDENYFEGSADSCAVTQAPQLLPGTIPVSGAVTNMTQSRLSGSSQSGAQLTIFYGGNVNVYDNIPSGKAQAIMQMAAGVRSSPSGEHNSRNERMYAVGDEASQCSPPSTPSSDSAPLQPMVPKALPLARKASLVRFLEKRKERMQVMAPYTKKNGMATGNPITVPNYGGAFPTAYTDYSLQPMMMPTGMNGHLRTLSGLPPNRFSTE